jgi:hypothetical protein
MIRIGEEALHLEVEWALRVGELGRPAPCPWDEPPVAHEVGEPEVGQARLARAEELSGPAQPEIDLGFKLAEVSTSASSRT